MGISAKAGLSSRTCRGTIASVQITAGHGGLGALQYRTKSPALSRDISSCLALLSGIRVAVGEVVDFVARCGDRLGVQREIVC